MLDFLAKIRNVDQFLCQENIMNYDMCLVLACYFGTPVLPTLQFNNKNTQNTQLLISVRRLHINDVISTYL